MGRNFRRVVSVMLCVAMIFVSCPEVFAVGIESLTAADKVIATTESAVKLDKQTKSVIAKIDAIGEVELTDACLTRIEIAENAYAELNAEQKKLVHNYGMLLSARSAYDALAADNEDTTAYQVVASGNIETVEWYVYSNGLLEIKGEGTIPTYSTSNNAPWYANASSIKRILVRSSITGIGAFAFYGLNNVTDVVVPFVGASRTAAGYMGQFGYVFGYTTNDYTSSFVSADGYYFSSYNGFRASHYSGSNYHYYKMNVPTTIKRVVVTDATKIGTGAFHKCTSINEIVLNDGVAEFGAYAFYGSNVLSSFAIPQSVTYMGEYSLGSCSSITYVAIPDGITNILHHTFYGCTSLNNVDFNDDIIDIANYSFYNTVITEIHLPDTLENIGEYAFAHASSNTSTKQINFGSGLKKICAYAFQYNNGITELKIPKSVETVEADVFKGCNSIKSATLPFVGKSRTATSNQGTLGYIFDSSQYSSKISSSSFIKIGGYYFAPGYGFRGSSSSSYYYYYKNNVPTSIKTVCITDATNIGIGAFHNCDSITKVVLNEGITSLGEYAFYQNTALYDFALPESISSIGDGCFNGNTKLKEISIPNLVTSIEEDTFRGCTSLEKVLISKNALAIKDHAFYGCNAITDIVIPDKVTEIGDYAFCSTNIKEIIIPDSVVTLGNYSFAHLSSSTATISISFGKGLKTIGENAFEYNNAITELEIPDNVESIGAHAFQYCNNLVSVTLPFVGASRTSTGYSGQFGYIFTFNANSYANESSFIYTDNDYFAPLYGFRAGQGSGSSKYYYYEMTVPTKIKTVVITDATKISTGAFSGCSNIESLTLNKEISDIGAYAFYNVKWFTNLSEKFESVGDGVLIKYNGADTSLIIPEDIKHIAGGVFKGTTTIEEVTLHDSLQSIGSLAFDGCTNIASMTIPKSVSKIGNAAIPTTCKIYVYRPSVGYDYRSTNREILNDSFTTGNDTYYYVVKDDGKIEIIGCVTTSTELTVPNEINGIIVDKIGDYGFKNCTTLNSITIPNNILNIGDYAFLGCTGLINATIPTTVNNVGNYAFKDCTGLVNVTISEGVETLGNGVFYNCTSLIEAVVPDTVVSVGHSAFYNCTSMTTATIGISAVAINDYTFYNCEKLNTVVIGYAVESVGNYAFYNCDLSKVSVPSSVKHIYNYAFAENTNMTRATLRKNLLTIGEGAFQNDKLLATVSIPSSVTEIGVAAFENCESVTSVTIPVGVVVLNDRVFNGCLTLAEVEINSQLTSIGASAFCDCAFVAIILPETVETVKESAFRRCKNLVEITLPDATTSIGEAAFLDATALSKISMADSVQTIGKSALINNNDLTVDLRYFTGEVADALFENQGVCHMMIAEDISVFGNNVFASCYNLSTVTYGDNEISAGEFKFSPSVKSFGSEAFKDATLLRNLIVPDTLQTVGANAFYNTIVSKYNCKDVMVTFYYVAGSIAPNILENQKNMSVFVNDNIHTIGNNAFASISTLDSVSLPDTIANCGTNVFASSGTQLVAYIRGVDGTVDASLYDGKTTGVVLLTIDENVSTIGNYAFANNPGLKVVVVNNAKTIGDYAFYNDISVNNLSLYGQLEHIGEHAFDSCKSIPEVVLPDTVRYIGAYAFYDCNSMVSINIPIGVTAINSHTFYGCASLKSMILPDTVKSIGGYAFYGCVLIEILDLGDCIETVGEYAFYNCNQVKEINLPETVEVIENYAFRSCSGITEIYIPDSVVSLGDCVFYGCTSLAQVEFGTGITVIGDRVFYACVALDKVTFNGNITEIHEMAYYGAEDATLCAFDNEYVETYCDDNGLLYYNLADEFTIVLVPPTKLEYIEFEELDTTGLALEITYGNGAERTIKTGFVVTGYDLSVTGEQTITVAYNGKTETFKVNVSAKTVAELSILSGNGTTIIVGEDIDTSNVIVKVVYTDGTSSELTEGYEIIGYDSQVIGPQNVTLKYRGVETELAINVTDYVRGDINGDGIVSMKDVTRLVNHLNDATVGVVDAALDVNGDGIVSIKDVTRLVEYLEDNTIEIN